MPLIEYIDSNNKSHFVFAGEEQDRLPECTEMRKMPPNPCVVHSCTEYFIDFQLDSINSIYELDAQLNREVAEEKELKSYNYYRKNI